MSASPTRFRGHLIVLIAFMWGAYFLNYCDRQAIFSMFKALEQDLKMSDQQLGLVGAVFLWVYGIGCPIAGQLADRFSKRLLVVLSLVIWSLVTFAIGFAGSALILLGLRAAMGISESLYMPAAITLTANSTPPQHRSQAVSMLTTAQIAGSVGGAWFGGWMAEQGYWRYAFFTLGFIGVIYAIPYFWFLTTVKEDTQLETTQSGSKFSSLTLFNIPTFTVLCITFPIFVFGLWMLYSWLPKFLEEKFTLGTADAAFHASVYMQTATLFGLFNGGWLADRLFLVTKASRMWLLVGTFFLCAPALYGIGNSPTLVMTSLSLTCFGLFSGFLMGNIFPASFEVVPADARASSVGILNFFGSALSGFAPLMVGTWKKSVGIERMLAGTACLYLIAGVILIFTIFTLYDRDWRKVHPDV